MQKNREITRRDFPVNIHGDNAAPVGASLLAMRPAHSSIDDN
jgi:hypothetical protein